VTELPLAGPRPAISEVAPEQLAAWLVARGEPAYRARQILAGVHRPQARGFGDLTDPGSRWSGSLRPRIYAFVAVLRAAGVPVTVRDTRGREIEAACGQLHAQRAGRRLPRSARPSPELIPAGVA
jgi:adenine C2-methylase RlmN of 23S rRNA A2503 and tRNA A37